MYGVNYCNFMPEKVMLCKSKSYIHRERLKLGASVFTTKQIYSLGVMGIFLFFTKHDF